MEVFFERDPQPTFNKGKGKLKAVQTVPCSTARKKLTGWVKAEKREGR